MGPDRARVQTEALKIAEQSHLFFTALQHESMPIPVADRLLRLCGVPRLNYLSRVGLLGEYEDALSFFDEKVSEAAQAQAGLPTNSLSPSTSQQSAPLRNAGFAFRTYTNNIAISVLLAPFPKPLLTSVDSVHTVSLQFLQPQFKRPSVLHESVSDPTLCLPSLLTTFQTTPYCSTPLPPSPNSNVCSPFLLQIGKQTLHCSLLRLPKLHATLQTPPLAPAPGLLILFQSTPCRMKFTQLHANYDATNPSRLHRRQLATVGPTSPTTPGTF